MVILAHHHHHQASHPHHTYLLLPQSFTVKIVIQIHDDDFYLKGDLAFYIYSANYFTYL